MMEILQLVIGIGLVGMLWRIATELSHLQTSMKFVIRDLTDVSERLAKIEDGKIQDRVVDLERKVNDP